MRKQIPQPVLELGTLWIELPDDGVAGVEGGHGDVGGEITDGIAIEPARQIREPGQDLRNRLGFDVLGGEARRSKAGLPPEFATHDGSNNRTDVALDQPFEKVLAILRRLRLEQPLRRASVRSRIVRISRVGHRGHGTRS